MYKEFIMILVLSVVFTSLFSGIPQTFFLIDGVISMKKANTLFGLILSGVVSTHADESWLRISTADGQGGDTTIEVGRDVTDYGERPLLGLHQNMLDAGVGQKIYLRFDLSRLANRRVEKAHLTLQPMSGYEARYSFNVFGLKESKSVADAGWQESGSGEALSWNNAPGHDPANAGGLFEVIQVQKFEEVEQTQVNGEVRIVKKKAGVRQEVVNNGGMQVNAVTYLGKISVRPGNNRTRLVSDDLAAFLNADRNGLATIVLTLAIPADQPITFASREHSLFDPPSLWVTTSASGDSVLVTSEQLARFPLPADLGAKNIELYCFNLGVKAHKTGWGDCVEDAERVFETLDRLYSEDPASSDTRLAVSLADLLRTETAFKASELSKDEWAERVAAVLARHPERVDDLLYAFYMLKGSRRLYEPERTITHIDLKPLLDFDLSPLARQTVMVLVVDTNNPLDKGEWLAYYRGLIPIAYGRPTTPYIIHQYAYELEKAEGEDAALIFLDQAAALRPDEPMGQAASVLRVSRESDPNRKAALMTEFVESGEGEVTRALRPHYLTHRARNGQLAEALTACFPGIHEHRSTDPRKWGQTVVGRIYEALAGSNRVTLFSKMEAAALDLGEVGSAPTLCADWAKQLYEEGKHLEAASVALGLLRHENLTFPGLQLVHSPEDVDEFLGEDTSANRQAVAALLLHRIYDATYETAFARKFLRDAASISAEGHAKALVLLYQALAEAERGKLSKSQVLLQEAKTFAPNSAALAELHRLLEAAGAS